MPSPSYKNEIERLHENTLKRQRTRSKPIIIRREIISANLRNLMPEIANVDHPKIIDEVYLNQQWGVCDFNHPDLVGEINVEGAIPDFNIIRANPTIFCSYHFGSYRLIALFLISKKIPFTALIDSQVADNQGEAFADGVRAARLKYNAPEECGKIIDTAKDNFIFSILKDLRAGKSLLVFIDGNTGVNVKAGIEEKRAKINFLDSTLECRKGIGYISYLSQISVTPLAMYRTNTWDNNLCFFPKIQPAKSQDRELYTINLLQNLYCILQEIMLKGISQWETWIYIEKSLTVITDTSVEKAVTCLESRVANNLVFNDDRYRLVELEEFGDHHNILFDRFRYNATPISENLKKLFKNLKNKRLSYQDILTIPGVNEVFIEQLLAKKILEIVH